MRRPLVITAVALAGAAIFAAGLGIAGSGVVGTRLSAKLVSRGEVPAPKSAARATGLFTASLAGRKLVWRLTFSHLTGRALAAHIHMGIPGMAGPVAVPLCGPCASGVHGTVTVTTKVRGALLAGTAYVNVHTAKNPGGEIRGQVLAAGKAQPGAMTHPTTTAPTTHDTSGGYG